MDTEMELHYEEFNAPGNDKVRVKSMRIIPIFDKADEPVTVKTPVDIEFEFWNYVDTVPINLSMHVYTPTEECVFNVGTESKILSKGVHKGTCKIPANFLNDGNFKITMMIVAEASYALYNFDKGLTLEIHEDRGATAWSGKWPGVVRPQMPFYLD
jgi:lipopolysaccharide transport system ATP-binding protein